ncbi:UbiA family prenyltransferase [Chthonobacter rhizosphaerae]|uniref:UbiA family prenyltransferase n=1 Tax=Chthonobacter rhizosphaerae TaxID=2735553 RepID=UPI0015EF9166|nr:UbiA family prenyltransferase [Chthonobacter rhizosphaerae]
MLATRHLSTSVLVVDLDSLLPRPAVLIEVLRSNSFRDWLRALSEWRASSEIERTWDALVSNLDVAKLYFDDAAIAVVRAWRDQGGRTALVSGYGQAFSERIAESLQLFDFVCGAGVKNVFSSTERDRSHSEDVGCETFAYMGHCNVKPSMWREASHIIAVNVPPSLRSKLEGTNRTVEYLTTTKESPKMYLRALRPHQWIKNILIFLPMLAAHEVTVSNLSHALLAFFAFCLVASSAYVINDLFDLASDRAHPRKRVRPFASGSIPVQHGIGMAVGLLAFGSASAAFINGAALLLLLAYYLITLAYSAHLKRFAVVDICVLAGLYSVRIFMGGLATGITLSVWLLAFSLFFFFALAAVKRQAELVDMEKRGRFVLAGRGYSVSDLPIINIIAIASGYMSVVVLALYVNSPAVNALYQQPAALWGICCVLLYWLTRIVLITHRGAMHDDPVIYAATDRTSQVCFAMAFGFALGATFS